MSTYGITAVRFDASGNISEVLIGKVDVQTNVWASEPAAMHPADVANLIAGGDSVVSIFSTAAGRVTGPQLMNVQGAGHETLAFVGDPVAGRTLHDLPTF